MQETTIHDLQCRHSVLRAGAKCHELRQHAYQRLLRDGFAASPTLTADIVTAISTGTADLSPDSKRSAVAAGCLRLVAATARERFSRRDADKTTRLEMAVGFLARWFAHAPQPRDAAESLGRLDCIALGLAAGDGVTSHEWIEWRRSEEQRLTHGGSPAFLHALAALRSSAPPSFSTLDERIWSIESGASLVARSLEVVARQPAGDDGRPIRSYLGAFHEVGADGIPPDPSRLVPSDLALLASPDEAAEALFACRIADSSLLVRFGSQPKPARKRPRIRLVAALEDDIEMHVQAIGQASPAIDRMREAFMHAVPAILRLLADLQIEVEVEIRREGPISQGSAPLPNLRTNAGLLRYEYRDPRAFAGEIARFQWMVDDAGRCSDRRARVANRGFDASLLVSFCRHSQIIRTEDWAGVVLVEQHGDSSCRLRSGGMLAQPESESLSLRDPRALGAAVAGCFGQAPTTETGTYGVRAPAEGVHFA